MGMFGALYVYAASLYPGGSQASLTSIGYDWANNYWCNLLNDQGMNGLDNPAQPFAIGAMIILCLSLLHFFFLFANGFEMPEKWRTIIKASGVLSMVSATLIATEYHDLMTTVSSIFGILVVAGIIKAVYSSDMTVFKWSGFICILLLLVNNYIYYTNVFLDYLPLIQKATFVLVLLWIAGLNVKVVGKTWRPLDRHHSLVG